MKKLIVISLLFIISACGSEPYPYAPQFVSDRDVPLPSLVAPPSPNSDSYKREIEVIIQRQATLSAKEKKAIYDERHVNPEMMVTPTLGAKFNATTYPALFKLLTQASSDSWRIGDEQKDYWHTLRPWLADSRVHLYVPEIKSPGYPSGHTVTNYVWASILSELWPEKSAIFFSRAEAIAMHRVDGGAHFFHDIEGGKQLAKLIYTAMRRNPDYQQELAEVRAEIASTAPSKAISKGHIPAMPMPQHSAACVGMAC
jgi:acid phosphatase (class A)